MRRWVKTGLPALVGQLCSKSAAERAAPHSGAGWLLAPKSQLLLLPGDQLGWDLKQGVCLSAFCSGGTDPHPRVGCTEWFLSESVNPRG